MLWQSLKLFAPFLENIADQSKTSTSAQTGIYLFTNALDAAKK